MQQNSTPIVSAGSVSAFSPGRRNFLGSMAVMGSAGVVVINGTASGENAAEASRSKTSDILSSLKITRVRFYEAPSRTMFNQSAHVCTVETDAGITGIGEGGSPDTIRQTAALLIGESPSRIEHLWQLMYRGYFYPPGREKLHAVGALDLALWDIKGKVLELPVYHLLGGPVRNYVECYSTGFPGHKTLRDAARGCIDAGFRAFRTSTTGSGDQFNSRHSVKATWKNCIEIREGVGPDGDWAIDYHTRLDMPDAVRLSSLIEELEPYFCEDLVRSENSGVYQQLREQVKVPIAVGEQFGDRWEINELMENRLIDYSRVSLPNAGGITEFMKIAAIAETHYVGLVPHFTGPIATAALVHACTAFPGPTLMEMTGDGVKEIPHLPKCYDFKEGKLWPNSRPGLGVELDTNGLKLVLEVTEKQEGAPLNRRPDGSITNW
jgi:galactonate dehydratase